MSSLLGGQYTQIIALGEQTHFDGATFDAKVQLIKYLHEQLGFNVLAFESGYYECSKANELLNRQQPSVLKEAVFGVWNTKALKELEEYILKTQNTPRPLKVTGFDIQFSGNLGASYFVADLESLLQKLGATALFANPKWKQFKSATERQIKYSNFFKKPSAADTTVIGEMVRILSTLFEAKKDERGENEKSLLFGKMPVRTLSLTRITATKVKTTEIVSWPKTFLNWRVRSSQEKRLFAGTLLLILFTTLPLLRQRHTKNFYPWDTICTRCWAINCTQSVLPVQRAKQVLCLSII